MRVVFTQHFKASSDMRVPLWWFTNDERLSPRAHAATGDEANDIFVSAASAWEIATKHRLGKLEEADGAVARIDEMVAADGFEYLPMRHFYANRADAYTLGHADPFGRMLAARCELEDLTPLTRELVFGESSHLRMLW